MKFFRTQNLAATVLLGVLAFTSSTSGYLTKVQYHPLHFPAIVIDMIQTRPFIAVLDDELQMCKALGRLLKTHGFEVATFTRGVELLAACASRLPNCVLLDLHMPDLNGFDVLQSLATLHPPVPVLVITGHDQLGNANRVRALGATDYLLKPLNETQLLAAIRKAIQSTGENTQP